MFDDDEEALGGVFGDPGPATQHLPQEQGTGASPDGLGAYAMPVADPNQPGTNTTGYNYELPQQAQREHQPLVPQMPPEGGGVQTMPAQYDPNALPMAGQLDWVEPADVSPESAVRSAGITALTAVVAAGTGFAAGGPLGALSGVLISGAGFNIYRGQKWWGSPDPSEKHEAVTSVVMGALGATAGAYAAYRAYEDRGDE